MKRRTWPCWSFRLGSRVSVSIELDLAHWGAGVLVAPKFCYATIRLLFASISVEWEK